MGLGIVLVTNQSGIGRGYFDRETVDRVHERVAAVLAREGIAIDRVYVCPHAPEDGCECRKPKPGLLLAAARDFGFDPRRCFVIGDKACDIDLGRAAGATTLLVRTGYGSEHLAAGLARPDISVDDLVSAAAAIDGLL
jgi:histidinol-phosphate phosphatase family protein